MFVQRGNQIRLPSHRRFLLATREIGDDSTV